MNFTVPAGGYLVVKQTVDPALDVLERILTSASCEAMIPLTLVFSFTRVGSNRSPVCVDLRVCFIGSLSY